VKGRTCYEGAPVSGKERRTWGVSPACGGMCKCCTDGRSTSSSPRTESVCRGGDEAAKVQGEHKVKVDPTGASELRKQVARGCHVIMGVCEPNAHRPGHSLYASTPSWALLGIFLKPYGIRSAAERSRSAVLVSEVTFSALDDDPSLDPSRNS
jgi:hypothetical protein